MTNTQRITLVSFLTYFLLSGMLAPIGIISTPMAEHFGQSVTDVTKQFSWLTGGNLIGAVLALFVFDWFRLKHLIVAIYVAIATVLTSLALIQDLTLSSIVLGVVGLGSGIGLAGGALTISRTYAADKRASMLVITDGCFSIAGFTTGWLATYFVAQSLAWNSTYQALGLLAIVVVVLALMSSFPEDANAEVPEEEDVPWPLPVWLCAGCLFLYTLGQYSMLFWLPNYAETRLGASNVATGSLVGQFWLGMFFAQVFVAWWVYRIGVRNLILIAAGTTFLFSIPLWTVTNIEWLTVLALIWGFANLSTLKAILSFATEQVPFPTATLVSLLLLGATMGTAVSPLVTSFIVELTSNHTILMFSTTCYFILGCIVLVIRRLTRG